MLRRLLDYFAPDSGGSGARGERLAADWLRRERGFAIIAQNWRNPRDERQEIDLICEDHEVLVFVEVKARVADALVAGYFAVDARKKRVLTRACKAYLARLRSKPRTFRFDVVEVAIPRNSGIAEPAAPIVRHFENVPLFSKHYRG
jgi:putative endonuclease